MTQIKFLKTKYYPVNIDKKEIINLSFKKESALFRLFNRTGFIGIKGHRLNDHRCYKNFDVLNGDLETVSKKIKEGRIKNED